MNIYHYHRGRLFKKSKFSHRDERWCVGVCVEESHVLVMNTNSDGPVLEFTKEEWSAFIKGVKVGEFDLLD